ncbi:MAG: V-type ATPase subunit [Fusobacterium sp.]|nr:V-type ATPase subunit [Fusobacterium sp.]
MNRLDYAHGVVVARVNEKKLLKKDDLDKMMKANSPEEVFKILLDSDYSKSAVGVENLRDYELLLKNETTRMFKLGLEMLDKKDEKGILELLSLKYNYHNLKSILKGKVSGINLENLFIYSILSDPNKIQLQFESGKFTNIRDEFKEALKEAEKKYSETNDPQIIDIVIDRAFYKHLKAVADSLEIDLFKDYASSIIDFYNLSSMMRARNMGRDIYFLDEILVEGGNVAINKLKSLFKEDFEKVILALKSEKFGRILVKYIDKYKETKSFTIIESVKDEYLSKLREDSKFVFFGPEPIFSYLLAKEKEIAIVRTIIIAKLNNISPEKIKERLGDIYNV